MAVNSHLLLENPAPRFFHKTSSDDRLIFNKYPVGDYGSPTFLDIPETFKDLVASGHWGASPPEIDRDSLRDPYDMPMDGTGEWIFEEPWFKEWHNGEGSQLLWLCGGPGTGKTMLSKRVAAKLLPGPNDPRRGVKFVYHFASPEPPTKGAFSDETESRKHWLAKVAWDLLYGMLQEDESLYDGCKRELERQGDGLFTNPNSLWKILRGAIRDSQTDSIYILSDGVDGLNEDLCKELIRRILGLRDLAGVKIFLSSRDVPHISNNLSGRTKINIDANDSVKVDLKTFIQRSVDAFGGWSDEQKTGAIKTLLAKSEGTFLWASLAIENLKQFCSGPNYEVFLRRLPSKLKNVYRKMLYDVLSREGSAEVLNMIRSVALAFRPLTLGEFGYILASMDESEVGIGHPRSCRGITGGVQPKSEEEIRQYVQSSWSFVRATTTHVSIVHHTAVEYLFDESLQDIPQIPTKSDLDFSVSWECFLYFHRAIEAIEKPPQGTSRGRRKIFQKSSSKGDRQENPAETLQGVARKNQQDALTNWPYLRYAAESWFLHARRSLEIAEHKFCGDPARNWLEHRFFDKSDAIRKPWIKLCGDPQMEILEGEQTPLHIAVCLGLTPLVKTLLDSNSATESTNHNQSPLHLAAKLMSEAYGVLVDRGSSSLLTASDKCGNTPLHQAAISGHRHMLVALVEKFAMPENQIYSGQINKKNNSGDTPLHLALRFDHMGIVKFLVEKGADLAIRNNVGLTALELGEKLGRRDISDIPKESANPREVSREETREETTEETGEETREEPREGPGEEYGEETGGWATEETGGGPREETGGGATEETAREKREEKMEEKREEKMEEKMQEAEKNIKEVFREEFNDMREEIRQLKEEIMEIRLEAREKAREGTKEKTRAGPKKKSWKNIKEKIRNPTGKASWEKARGGMRKRLPERLSGRLGGKTSKRP